MLLYLKYFENFENLLYFLKYYKLFEIDNGFTLKANFEKSRFSTIKHVVF